MVVGSRGNEKKGSYGEREQGRRGRRSKGRETTGTEERSSWIGQVSRKGGERVGEGKQEKGNFTRRSDERGR